MSILARLKSGTKYLAPSPIAQHSPTTALGALSGFAVDKGERYAASYLFGYIKGFYREKSVFHGYGVDLWAGGALTLASGLLDVLSHGRSHLAPHLGRIGDSGVTSCFNSWGTAAGARKSGRTVYVTDAGAKPAIPAGLTAVGAIPAAAEGAYLTAEELAAGSAARV